MISPGGGTVVAPPGAHEFPGGGAGMTLSAGVVVVRNEGGLWRYLLLRAYRNWDFPKGVVEPGEDPLETARREVMEEAGIEDLDFRWGYVYRETAPYRGGAKVARYFIARTGSSRVALEINPALGKPEHDEYRWVDYGGLERLAPARLRPIVEWAAEIVASG